MDKMTLYDYSSDFIELFDKLDELQGDEDLEQAWFDTLESIECDFMDKAENIAAYIKSLNAYADTLKAEEKHLAERRRAKENRAERLKKYLLECMETTHITKIDRPMAQISVRNNAESPRFKSESEFIAWAQENADELLRYKPPEIDKTAVKKFLQDGGELDGVTLERSKSVIIK